MPARRRWWSVSLVLFILLLALMLMACEALQTDRQSMAPSTEPATAPSSAALFATATALAAQRPATVSAANEPTAAPRLSSTMRPIPLNQRPTPQPEATPPTRSKTGSIADLASLMKTLRAQGLKVRFAGAIEDPLLPGTGTALIVNGADVQVFEYADNNAVQAALAMINPDGSLVDVDIDWDGSPHFYQSGRIIALYIGNNDTVTKALTRALGTQIAGWQ
jgi:hypothetical protein